MEQYDAYYLQMKRLNMDDEYLRRLRKMGKGAVGREGCNSGQLEHGAFSCRQ